MNSSWRFDSIIKYDHFEFVLYLRIIALISLVIYIFSQTTLDMSVFYHSSLFMQNDANLKNIKMPALHFESLSIKPISNINFMIKQ